MTDRTKRGNRNAAERQARMMRRRRRKRRLLVCYLLFSLSLICLILLLSGGSSVRPGQLFAEIFPESSDRSPQRSPLLPEGVPDELMELLEHNQETYEFVKEYPHRETYLKQTIDLSADPAVADALAAGQTPLLMQWDLRWGYAPYGDDIVGLAGCGPVCLSMAYLRLTGKTDLHPAAMAEFAFQHGFYSEYGTDWALWTDGASLLGLSGETVSLSESAMKSVLKNGGVIICSMRPGDFTTTGHFILIRDFDENGFYVNDPNRKSNCDRQWTYEELSRQIKNLWSLTPA